jgi:hypothetical protein
VKSSSKREPRGNLPFNCDLETGTEFRSAADAWEFLKWLDQLEILVRSRDRFPTAKHRELALEQINEARAVYAKIVQDAKK